MLTAAERLAAWPPLSKDWARVGEHTSRREDATVDLVIGHFRRQYRAVEPGAIVAGVAYREHPVDDPGARVQFTYSGLSAFFGEHVALEWGCAYLLPTTADGGEGGFFEIMGRGLDAVPGNGWVHAARYRDLLKPRPLSDLELWSVLRVGVREHGFGWSAVSEAFGGEFAGADPARRAINRSCRAIVTEHVNDLAARARGKFLLAVGEAGLLPEFDDGDAVGPLAVDAFDDALRAAIEAAPIEGLDDLVSALVGG